MKAPACALAIAAVLALPSPARADPAVFTLSAQGTASGQGDRFGVFGPGEPATFQLTVDYDRSRVRGAGGSGWVDGVASLTVTGSTHSVSVPSAPFDAGVRWDLLEAVPGSSGPRYSEAVDISYRFINGSVEVIELGLALLWDDARIAPFTLAEPRTLATGGPVAAFFRINQTQAGERVGFLDFATPAWTLTSAAPVPEPAGYALFLGGLAIVALAARRRAG